MKSKFSIPFLDVLFSFLLVLICIIMLLNYKQNSESGLQQQAIYQIVMTWESNNDVDLHCQDPIGNKVSFQRREGGDTSLFSLNRDSLGWNRTESNNEGKIINSVCEEVISIRGIYAGEYICNGHMYNKKDFKESPVKVKLVRVKPYKEIVEVSKVFSKSGEEQTFFRFTLDKDGQIKDVNYLPAQIVYPSVEEEYEVPEPPKPELKNA